MQRQRFQDRVLASVDASYNRLKAHHGSQAPGASMSGDASDDEAFTAVSSRRRNRRPSDLILCTKPGCTGKCPRTVVVQGLRGSGFVPARCLVCDRAYKIPPGAGSAAASNPRQPQKAVDSKIKKLQDECNQLRAEAKQLKAKAKNHKATAAADDTQAEQAGEAQAADCPNRAQALKLQQEIRQLKDIPAEIRDKVCGGSGGHATLLAQMEEDLQQAWARVREQRPISQQKASADLYVKKKQKIRDQAASELQELLKQQSELEKQIADQQEELTLAETSLQQARQDAVVVSEKATAELRGDGSTGNLQQSSIVTAMVVKDFFQKMPPEVIGHHEGQDAILQIMRLLDKLDVAAKSIATQENANAAPAVAAAAISLEAPVTNGGQPQPPCQQVDEEMQIDEDLITQMAEAAVPETEGDDTARQLQVSEARDRIRAKRTDIAKGFARVRKAATKR